MKLVVSQKDIDAAYAAKEDAKETGRNFLPSKECPVSKAASKLFGVPCTSSWGGIMVHDNGDTNAIATRTYACSHIDMKNFQQKFDGYGSREKVEPEEFDIRPIFE